MSVNETIWACISGRAPVWRLPHCAAGGHAGRTLWGKYVRRDPGLLVRDGAQRERWFCGVECLRPALLRDLRRIRLRHGNSRQHRIPIGLLLVSRGVLDPKSVRDILEQQRQAGVGRFGYWAQHLGYASETDITAAVAAQWGCPVITGPVRMPEELRSLPLRLLSCCRMIPVHFARPTRTLHVAFSEVVNYSALYALEHMLDCHAESCIAADSAITAMLEDAHQVEMDQEVIFDRDLHIDGVADTICSYASEIRASELRYALSADYLWARLNRAGGSGLNLLFRRGVSGEEPSF